MVQSRIQKRIQVKKNKEGDYLAEAMIDLCFVTSYKIEDLIKMPRKRLNLLIERFYFHFSTEDKKHGK